MAEQGRFADGDVGGPSQLYNRVARYAFENPGVDCRRQQHAALRQENVVAGAFRYLALVIEHQRLDATGADAFNLGKDVIEIIQGLNARIDGVRMVANRRGRHDLQAMLVEFGRVERDVINNDDDLRIGRFARIIADRAGAARDNQPDVTFLLIIQLDSVIDGFRHLLARQRDFEPDGQRAFV